MIKDALRLTRLARHILRRVRQDERDADAWREAFHDIIPILYGLLSGEISSEQVKSLFEKIPENLMADDDKTNKISVNSLDKSPKFDKIKSRNFQSNTDGGSGSGNFGHKGRPGQQGGSGQSLSPAEKAKITKRLVGQSTHDEIIIKSVSLHAFDRIAGRKMSVGRIDRMRNTGTTSPGNLPHTRCYDIDGSRMVIDTNNGKVITVMWRKGGK